MTRTVLARFFVVMALSIALVGASLSVTTASAATPKWKPRAPQYAGTVTERDVAIPMSDGTILRGDVMRPADARAGRRSTSASPSSSRSPLTTSPSCRRPVVSAAPAPTTWSSAATCS
ncbi:hypothetical protein [Aeromicrobium sp. UC242_57]|uniref:hypothetical protein n=1 Tax=Aeromicrobium sp. UC242_57 TaxID=3374624 RepID=UPI0037A5852A